VFFGHRLDLVGRLSQLVHPAGRAEQRALDL
jgi:hypothetical protein